MSYNTLVTAAGAAFAAMVGLCGAGVAARRRRTGRRRGRYRASAARGGAERWPRVPA